MRAHRAATTLDRDPNGTLSAMIEFRALDEIASRLSALVPPGFDGAREDLTQTFRATLQSALGRLNLVAREEFEVQRLVLLRTRERLEALERQVAALESQPTPRA
jgi:BMFP domain-containing protein YqiC